MEVECDLSSRRLLCGAPGQRSLCPQPGYRWARDVGAVRQLAGCELRHRWRSVVLLVLLVGLVGAIVLATVAGARRTSSALARFNSSSRAATVQLNVPSASAAQLRRLGTCRRSRVSGSRAQCFCRVAAAPNLTLVPAEDTKIGTVVDRPRVLAGRVANPSAVDELAIDECSTDRGWRAVAAITS
jgi:hypothetical protein